MSPSFGHVSIWAIDLVLGSCGVGWLACRLQLVIADIDARASSEHKAMELLTRFRKTTLRRMQGLEGRVPDDAEILGKCLRLPPF